MPTWTIRPFRPSDLAGVLATCAAAAPADRLTPASFTTNVLLDPNHAPGGLRVAVDDRRVVGVVYAVAPTGPTDFAPAGASWITLFAVHPDRQRRGLGRALLADALDWVRGRGAAWVELSGYPPAYFLPGVDERYARACAFFESAGFVVRDSPVAMDRELSTYEVPPQVRALQAQRERQGYRFGPATAGDLPAVIGFASARLAPDWGAAVRLSVLRYGRPERILLARDGTDGREDVVGFAIYGCYDGVPSRFGPFGVDERERGKKLGEVLLHLTLERMHADGAHAAWFLWSSEDSPAGHLYRKSGFRVSRRFQVMRKHLTP